MFIQFVVYSVRKPVVYRTVDYEWSLFFLRDSKASETRARVKITHAGKARRGGEGEREGRASLALLSLRKIGDYS